MEQSLTTRVQNLAELESEGPSAPLSEESEETEDQLYPSLPTMPR